MNNVQDASLILSLDDPSSQLALVGGKGASLTRMVIAGLPVPPGFHITVLAYRRFVEENGLQEQILRAVSSLSPSATTDYPAALDGVSTHIVQLFAQSRMSDDLAKTIHQAYMELGGDDLAVAVRSSATAEDLPDMSFAGQQETYLNMHGSAMVLEAVKRCWASLWTSRAIDYRASHNISSQDISLAVVIQTLVLADASGVLFTVDPLTGASSQITINAIWGLGEAIVGGKVTPDTLLVEKVSGRIIRQEIAEKLVMTVRTPEGTHEEAVSSDKRTKAVLTAVQAAELTHIAVQIEDLYAQPMDIEWAMKGSHFSIVQARPITTLHSNRAAFEEWNDSLNVDYLWTNGNLGEAVPDVMTPCTWSLVQIFMSEATSPMYAKGIREYLPVGNIGGRFYMNISLTTTMSKLFGVGQKRFKMAIEEAFGHIPDDLDIPVLPLSRWGLIRAVLPIVPRLRRRVSINQKRLPTFLSNAPEHCRMLLCQMKSISNSAELIHLWRSDLEPFFRDASAMLEAATRQEGNGSALYIVRRDLAQLVGETDANVLLSGLSRSASPLASLGPLLGLAQLNDGEIDRATFVRLYGHRAPHEFEVFLPRPAEDANWIDQQLSSLHEAPVDVKTLLARQKESQVAAWERFRLHYPRKSVTMRRRIERSMAVFRDREMTRSEVIRVFWVLREFVLRAGKLTKQGDAVFFLSIDEILALLSGNEAALIHVPARRTAYERYSALPPYPALIRGHFDPLRWAADPHRRSDVFDASGTVHEPLSALIIGFPGAEGIVEGLVRVVSTAYEGNQLQTGEILVTTVTNVGWTPLFPRATAIVTDVGAPLSHAAIVARELGIPAVVGCGDATMRLHTGDLVRVDGKQGTIEVLKTAIVV